MTSSPQTSTAPTDSKHVKVRAPELVGRRWMNSGGKDLSLADLRGKVVLLDFWTFCCINCLHVLDELRPLEEKYSKELVIIGVHSPKFEFERTVEAVDQAVERYQVEHLVLDDPDLVTWQAYTARAWPTLAVIDPEGYLVATLSGEGHGAGLGEIIEGLIAEHSAKGTLHSGDGPYVPPPAPETDLFYPGKVTRLPSGNLLVADSGHHSLVEYDPTGVTILRRIGTGERGAADGDFASASFSEPGGIAVLPDDIAATAGYRLVVADTVNHVLRGIDLDSETVTTIAGTGDQHMVGAVDNVRGTHGPLGRYDGPALDVKLSSPWDVLFVPDTAEVVVAMAGNHTIWSFDPVTGSIRLLAGTMNEGLLDGDAETAWFAQSSGLDLGPEGDVLIADSETSAVRRLDPATGAVSTLVGAGLFDFGFRDGPAGDARLQHPLGVRTLPDGSIAIADTYNGAIRRYDPTTDEVTTLARGLREPSDILVVDAAGPSDQEETGAGVDPGSSAEAAEAELLVVESASHALTRVKLPKDAQRVDEGALSTRRPPTEIAPGPVAISVSFSVPAGQKLDDRWGDPTFLQVSATPPGLIVSGEGGAEGLERDIVLNPDCPSGVLHVTARAAACDGEPGGEIPLHAACHLYQQDWGIPVDLVDTAPNELTLDLRGA
ncbi:thiol-disulfide isomerase/thioredoxin [Brevibacterium sanguinis]|uniref:Thiol-disulfide isomerase/thioredoxin n=2 Tax=Brevibacterium TaxID=1696 RepID=A0A366IPB2_9MICO|nr:MULTISPECIES: NHL domain-containing thioredoxin family protein [Brevibacterium]RBP67095.1 thiol-disulfide isomerase/thioredoxin [Brevibacterium sanguinis]RBP73620.1 thiol-disulfide isomerase/thioredoxin [Brevibacterium celere]